MTRVELWVEVRAGRPAVNPVVTELLRALSADGLTFTVRVPELDPLGQPRGRRPDLVLLKTVTTLALSVAVADEAAGGLFVNSAAASSASTDKAAVVARLAAAGVPVPASYLVDAGGPAPGRDPRQANDDPEGWVTKPVLGWHGAGVAFHPTLGDALAGPLTPPPAGWLVDDGTWLVQRRVGAGEPDLKVYAAGEALFAATKAFDARSFASNDVRPVELDTARRDIVLAAGAALGLRVFGVDLRVAAGVPVVIDVNPFPGFRGFPGAVPALRAEIDAVLRASR